mgnify:CR=1 FL=1
MGDAKRRKLLDNGYRLEPVCTNSKIEVVGLPPASKQLVYEKLQKHWSALPYISSKQLKNLIDVAKDNNGGVVVNVDNGHSVIPASYLIDELVPDLLKSPTATEEIKEILSNYDPDKEFIGIYSTPLKFTDEIDKLLRGNKVLYVIIHQYQLENIYS